MCFYMHVIFEEDTPYHNDTALEVPEEYATITLEFPAQLCPGSPREGRAVTSENDSGSVPQPGTVY